ncbi:MAG: imidazole glycerol phosphate synthase subunit HisH, partial [Bacillota bacterium]
MAAVGLVDYGMGNLASVERAIRAAAPGLEVVRITRPEELGAVQAVVLPGVGAFEAAMAALARAAMDQALAAYLREGRPLLGICLGYELLFDESEEIGSGQPGGAVRGLGWLPGRVRRFPEGVT